MLWAEVITFIPMSIPRYPEKTPIVLEHQQILAPILYAFNQGISELTFANLYLFRDTYQYQVSIGRDESGKDIPIIFGNKMSTEIQAGPTTNGEPPRREYFAMLPAGYPGIRLIEQLLDDNCYIKNFPEDAAENHRIQIEKRGFCVTQDRTNFDYIYSREDLASLSGRRYHKKRNLVNAFINSYNYEEKHIDPLHREDLYTILDAWRDAHDEDGDYAAAKEAIDRFSELGLHGCITYVDGVPGAYSMGEEIQGGSMFAIHFEKAIESYKGIYQFINRSFAIMLDPTITTINREQDLGDAGLRQAKMSYRPTGFVKKYRIACSEYAPCPEMDQEHESETEEAMAD